MIIGELLRLPARPGYSGSRNSSDVSLSRRPAKSSLPKGATCSGLTADSSGWMCHPYPRPAAQVKTAHHLPASITFVGHATGTISNGAQGGQHRAHRRSFELGVPKPGCETYMNARIAITASQNSRFRSWLEDHPDGHKRASYVWTF